MKALLCRALEGPEALEWSDIADPESPQPDQLQIAVSAATVNFADTLLVRGKYQIRLQPPFVPGIELAGTVVQMGSHVSAFHIGQRVTAVLPQCGAFAERVNVSASAAFATDPRLSDAVAACIPSVYGTAWYALVRLAHIQPGETLLVLGAAGGMGTASIQLAHKLGARVIAAVSDSRKAEIALNCGAEQVIDYTRENLKSHVLEIVGEAGVDVVMDPVGGDTTREALRCLGWAGRYLVVGFASGSIPAIAANQLLLKGAHMIGVNLGRYAMLHPAEAVAIYRELNELLGADSSLWPVIDTTLPMCEGAEALRMLEQRRATGKIVLVN